MFDLETIHNVNEAAAARHIRAHQRALRVPATNSLRLLEALEVGLKIYLKVGRHEEVVFAGERMLEIALKYVPQALEAIMNRGTTK